VSGFGFGFGFGINRIYKVSEWLPSDIANVALWVRPEELTSGDISQWDDVSGNSNHLVTPGAGTEPSVATNQLDGYSAAVFDGVDENLDLTSDLTFSGEYYIFAVYKSLLTTNYAILSGAAAAERPFFVATDGRIWANNFDGGVPASNAGVFDSDTFTLWECSRGASNGIFPYENGTDRRLGTPVSGGASAIRTMGRRSTEYMPGTVCEAIVVIGNMTPAERILTYNYLDDKYSSLSITVPGSGGPLGDYLVTVGGLPVGTVGGDYVGPV